MYPRNTVLHVSPWVPLYLVPPRLYFTMAGPQLWDGRCFRAHMMCLIQNGMYYHGPVSVFALTFHSFHPPFCLPKAHLASLPPLLRLQHLRYWALHIPLHHMPKTFYYLINIVVKAQTLPFTSCMADLLNGMCPLGNISYFLLVFLLRLVSP